jgi:hypothetical protein
MNGLSRVLVPIVLVVALIAGVTFVSMYTGKPAPVKTTTPAGEMPLNFPNTVSVWDPDDDTFVAASEPNGVRFYDFWFTNTNPQVVKLAARSKSCTCTSVLLNLVTPELSDALLTARVTSAAANMLSAVPLPDLPGIAAELMLENREWVELKDKAEETDVPAADPVRGPQVGAVRLFWKGKGTGIDPLGPRRLRAELTAHLPGQPAVSLPNFDMTLKVTTPLNVSPPRPDLEVYEIRQGDRKSAECIVWSQTRESFELTPREVDDDPCFEFQVSAPLGPAELAKINGLLNNETRVLTARRVVVTVSEEAKGKHLPIGPLERLVKFKVVSRGTELPESPSMTVKGIVRGDLQIGKPADKDMVQLGDFDTKYVQSKTIRIVATKPGMKLSLDAKQESVPAGVQVKLDPLPDEGGKSRWDLSVSVPPETLSGALSPTAAILLKIEGDPPRAVRVPLVGTAYRK